MKNSRKGIYIDWEGADFEQENSQSAFTLDLTGRVMEVIQKYDRSVTFSRN